MNILNKDLNRSSWLQVFALIKRMKLFSNCKLFRHRRIYTGSFWAQVVVLIVMFGIAIAVFCVVWGFLGAESKEIIKSFFYPSTDWENWEEQVGERMFRPIIGVTGTVFLSGFLISMLTNALKNKQESILSGKEEYHLKGHIVIIGFDETVPGIIRQLILSDKYRDTRILLQSSADINLVRDKVATKLLDKEKSRVVYVNSLRTSEEELRKLHTVDSREIFVIGDRTRSDHDSENMHIVRMLHKIHQGKSVKPIPMKVWFETEVSYSTLQLNDIKKEWKEFFEFMPCNFYKDWADRILVSSHYQCGRYETIIYPKLDHSGISQDSTKHVHVVVIGMNRMGIAVAKNVAQLLHFPNFNEQNKANQTVVTFIDDNADKEMQFFKGRHPGYFAISPVYYHDAISDSQDFSRIEALDTTIMLYDYLDVRFEFIKGRIESDNVRNWLKTQAMDRNQYLSIFICLHNPTESLGCGLYLPEEVYCGQSDDEFTNIFIRQETSSSLVLALRSNVKYSHVYPFGMLSNSMDIDGNEITIAQEMHDVYNKQKQSTSSEKNEWKDLSISKQWSNIYLANSFDFKLRSIGCALKSDGRHTIPNYDKEVLARAEHNRWNMEKLLLGYRAYNDDEECKYKTLAGEEKERFEKYFKDKLFIHNNIRPYNTIKRGKHGEYTLDGLDDKAKQYDRNIIERLPKVIEIIRQYR